MLRLQFIMPIVDPLDVTVDCIFSSRNNTDLLTNKLGTACYVLRSIKTYMFHLALIMVYYTLFHLIMTYGIIFWGNSSHSQNSSRYKQQQLELLWGIRVRTLAGTYSKT